jgi:hypothetical protein
MHNCNWLRAFTGALILTLGSVSAAQAAPDRIAFGATALSSVHYTYAAAATKAVNEKVGDKLEVTVMATGGAVDNLQRIRRGQINLGLGTYETVYQAYKGIGKFEGQANPQLRGLWVHSPAMQAWVVRKDSGIENLQGLQGMPFTPGQRGSATEQLVIQMLEVLQIKPKFARMSLSDAVDALKDGRILGYTKAGGTASLDGTTMEVMATTPLNILSFTPEQVKQINAELPFIGFQTVKDGQIEGFPSFTTPVQVVGEFTTADGMTEEQVMALLEGIVENQGPQVAAFPSFGKIDVMQYSVDLISIPLHAGAVKFYRSRGIEVPERLIPPEMK